ncbi:nitrite reductase small subunit NirD [Pseudolysinimonas kribbensis]|nr:nitrite reductase small subunit NirD [Pseudolysinimonas kribbensis]
MTDWMRACRADELEPDYGEAVLLDGEPIALVLTDGVVYAVGHRDPTSGAPVMARGIVGSRGDRPTLASPLHKEIYDLRTGECLSTDAPRLPTYPVRIADGWVEVSM